MGRKTQNRNTSLTLPPPPGRRVLAPLNFQRGGGWVPLPPGWYRFQEPWWSRQYREPWQSRPFRGPWQSRPFRGPWLDGLRGLGTRPGHYSRRRTNSRTGALSGLDSGTDALSGLDAGKGALSRLWSGARAISLLLFLLFW